MASKDSTAGVLAAQQVLLAGVSNCVAASLTNPVDVVKVRMQMGGIGTRARVSLTATASELFRVEGYLGFTRGLAPSLCREMSYSGLRLGLYEPVKTLLGATDPAHTPLYLKLAAGALTGALGSAIANPFDLVKVRMQSQAASADSSGRFKSASMPAVLKDIAREGQGVRGLWRGCSPTVKRAALLTASQVPSYDHAKHTLINADLLKEGYLCHLVCSMFAGVVASTVTAPVDLVKSRLMAQPVDPASGRGLLYTGVVDCVRTVIREEGHWAFYKGYHTQWLRIGPHTTVSLMVFENLRNWFGLGFL